MEFDSERSTNSSCEAGGEEGAEGTISATLSRASVHSRPTLTRTKSLNGMHIKAKRVSNLFDSDIDELEGIEKCLFKARVQMHRVMKHVVTDALIGCIVILDIWMTALGIDYRAAGEPIPSWMDSLDLFCLMVYIVELSAHAFVKRLRIFEDKWQLLDMFFVIAGLTELCMGAVGLSMDSIGILRILRVARIARLIKIFRKFSMLKELRKILQMASSCVKTLFWSFLFCWVVMSSFAMVAVEFMGPLVKELEAQGVLDDCGDSCIRSMASVTFANLYLFKTIIAGDGWGALAWPMMDQHPWTAIIFIGSHLVLVFGVLNMIVAVVVDTAAEQRLRDVKSLAEDLEADTEQDLNFLEKIFRQLDEDGSNDISLDELMKGAETIPDFSERLRVMDIDSNDLQRLFFMLDADGGGSIDLDEFRIALSRWMLNDSKTASRFVKHGIESLQDQFDSLAKTVQGISSHMGVLSKTADDDSDDSAMHAGVSLTSSWSLRQAPSESVMTDERAGKGRQFFTNGIDPSQSCDPEPVIGPLMDVLQRAEQDVKAIELRLEEASLQSTSKLLAEAVRHIHAELEKSRRLCKKKAPKDSQPSKAGPQEKQSGVQSRPAPTQTPVHVFEPRGEPSLQLDLAALDQHPDWTQWSDSRTFEDEIVEFHTV